MSTYTVTNPATEETVTTVETLGVEEVDRATDRAAAAYPAWRAVTPADRARLLRRFADVVDA
ncbi:MAG TPA: aldehyde dehydrogenase family protein, partial [Acidimicrobiales bacterium]|nr:aldehyde dehydrogenase family protein [Acidimicrobiales bacterium]